KDSNNYYIPLFFEGVVDLDQVPGASLCFQSFIMQTTTSAQNTAANVDLVAGGFSGVPPPPTVTNVTVCVDNLPATITATCSEGNCVWYANSSGGSPLGQADGVNGCSIAPPNLTIGVHTYYAACNNGECEGNRTAGTITVVGKSTVVGDVIPSEADDVIVNGQ